MFTPRFQFNDPNEPSNSLANLNFIPRFLQDPLFITIKDPTPAQQGVLLDEARACIHPAAFEMITSALKHGTGLDRNLLSHIAETGRVTIEEATSLVWDKGAPEVTRYVIIKRLAPEESDTKFHDTKEASELFTPDRFQLTIEVNRAGEVEASLGWENGDCADSHQSLIRRWEMVDTVFGRLGRSAPPLDLLPHAVAHSDERGDDEYNINGIALVCYHMNEDVILQNLGRDERARQAERDQEDRPRDEDEDDDVEDPFGLFVSAEDDREQEQGSISELHFPSSEYADEDDSDESGSDGHIYPGEDLTILDPTAGQLTAIAKLSSMHITRELAASLMEMTLTTAPLVPEPFEAIPHAVRDRLALHRRMTFTLDGGLRETSRYSIDELMIDKPTMFSINLSRQPALTKDSSDFVKAVLHWEMFSEDADIPNWDRILKVAKERKR